MITMGVHIVVSIAILLLASLPLVASQSTTTTTTTDNCSSSLLTDANLPNAVEFWITRSTREGAEEVYGGPISEWDVSCITSMKSLFKWTTNFQEDLSKWNTSRVKHLDQLLEVASGFQANLTGWDTSRVVSMNGIFHRSSGVDADRIGMAGWNTAKVADLRRGSGKAVRRWAVTVNC